MTRANSVAAKATFHSAITSVINDRKRSEDDV